MEFRDDFVPEKKTVYRVTFVVTKGSVASNYRTGDVGMCSFISNLPIKNIGNLMKIEAEMSKALKMPILVLLIRVNELYKKSDEFIDVTKGDNKDFKLIEILRGYSDKENKTEDKK